jgi:hypothetical protein
MRPSCTPCLFALVVFAAAGAGCDKSPPPAPAAAPSAPAPPPAAAAAPEPSATAKPTGKTVDTAAGLASEVGSEIHLAGKTIYPPPECAAGTKDACAKVKALHTDGETAKILRYFDGPGGPRSILLVQVTAAGNACNGGPLFFVRVAKDAAPQYSDVLDHCGGPDPQVGAMADKILITVPPHHPNHGSGSLPATTLEYDIASGSLKPPAKKKG